MSFSRFVHKAHRFVLPSFVGLIQKIRCLFYKVLSSGSIIGSPILEQPILVVGEGNVKINGRVKIGWRGSPFFLSTNAYFDTRTADALISVDDGTHINNGFSAIVEYTSIKIGKRVLIGTNVEIMDSDFHGLRLVDRPRSSAEWARPVVIEDDVFIGNSVHVLKGVTIGSGSVIGNGSVVVASIPPNVIAAGNPARVIREL
ncbi:MAG: DapH/DapD/GlmU-related protein [Alphaproteobacteria bacterium]|nr:DapH/DapD/GlmU-related protein [Alphaproteobacteria bacterium]